MDEKIVKRFILSETHFPDNATYVIYGTQKLAKIYYEVLFEWYGKDVVDFFIDTSLQSKTIFCNHSVMHIDQLKSNRKENQLYIIAAFHNEQDRMWDNMIEAGIEKSKILPKITYFREDYLEKQLNNCKEIFFYEEFENVQQIEQWIEESSYYLDYRGVDIRFHYNCKDLKIISENINFKIHRIDDHFRSKLNKHDIIIVRNLENIKDVKKIYENSIFCIDDEFNAFTKAYMYTAIANFTYGSLDYSVNYKNNFQRLLDTAEGKKGVLVCGNGPSLKNGIVKNRKLVSQLLPIVCNDLYQMEDLISIIKPKCYTLSDQFYFQYDSRENLKNILNYIEKNDCYLIYPLKWQRLIIQKYNVNINKIIALDFVRDQIMIPNINNLKCCPSRTVVLTMGVPLGIACKKDIYFMGCDGKKMNKDEKKMDKDDNPSFWNYQEGLKVDYLNSYQKKDSFIGIAMTEEFSDYAIIELESSYEKWINAIIDNGHSYYTLTHSYFDILEKNYLKEKEYSA
ncbi:MAG: hypothetical protein MR922_05885 [Lachnospiraceae bacterium]|nr:hypothetical protein [Lachnospiraceae bacterium]